MHQGEAGHDECSDHRGFHPLKKRVNTGVVRL